MTMEYMRIQAEKRGVSVSALEARIMMIIARDRMVDAVLDDADELARPPVRRNRMTYEDRRRTILGIIARQTTICIRDLVRGSKSEHVSWAKVFERMVDEGDLIRFQVSFDRANHYRAAPVDVAHDAPSMASAV